MEGNFSERVQEVIRLSREEALRLGHDYIGTEHLLLGIIRENHGVAVKILLNLGVDLAGLKKTIEDTVRISGGTLTIGNIPLTKQAEKVLKITQIESKIYKSDVIGTAIRGQTFPAIGSTYGTSDRPARCSRCLGRAGASSLPR